MAVQIKWRRATAAGWTATNPILGVGEPGFETDTAKFKIGNGISTWTALTYASNMSGSADLLAALFTDVGTEPAAPASGKLKVYTKPLANRMLVRQQDSAGEATFFQPHFGRNKVGIWNPSGNSTTIPMALGHTGYTLVTGNANNPSQIDVATTNAYTRLRRIGFVSTTTAANVVSVRSPAVQIFVGDGQNNNGFLKIIRFGISDPAAVTDARMFIGISASVAAPTNVEPSTLTNGIGVGHGATDTNLKLYYGGSTAQTPIDLGANFPSNTQSADAYELALFSPPNQYAIIYYEITRIITGQIATGVITGDGAGNVLPSPYTALSYAWNYRTNNATAAAVRFDIISDYIETDN